MHIGLLGYCTTEGEKINGFVQKKIMPMTGDNGFWKFGFIGFGTIAVLGTGLIIFDKKGKKQKHRKHVTKK